MRRWLALGGGLILTACLTDGLRAQIPGAAPPPVPGAAATPVAGAVPAAQPAAQPLTLWSFLGLTPENCDKCRARCCKTPLGQLLNSMTKPVGFASGGLVPPLCPPAELAKLADPNALTSPGESAAAKIMALEAGAAARRAAMRYLGTVDCRRFPEAEKALIDGLRADTNECVRLEAALALANGCCCTKETIAALALTVGGETTDKNPAECSERVKAAAAYALQVCMSRQCDLDLGDEQPPTPVPPEAPPKPEEELPPPTPGKAPAAAQRAVGSGLQLTSFYTSRLPRLPAPRLTQDAGRTLAATVGTPEEPRPLATGGRSLFQILDNARCRRGVAEEIPFDEAALTSLPVRATPPAPSARAALTFAVPQAGSPSVGARPPASQPDSALRRERVAGELTRNLGADLPQSRVARPQIAGPGPQDPVMLIGAPPLLDARQRSGN